MLLLSSVSCTRYQECDKLLAKADSLMNIAPDSALRILDSLEASSTNFQQSTLRGMDKSNVSNTKSRLYKKLFGKEGTGKDLDSRLLGI